VLVLSNWLPFFKGVLLMITIALTDCCAMLGIDPKTLRHWLRLASLQFAPHPTDARLKCLTLSQVQQLASLHGRHLPLPGSVPPALQETAPVLGLTGEHAQTAQESQAQLLQAAPLLPPSVSEEADLRKQLSCLERSMTSMQEQLAQFALELLQERSLRFERRLSALEAHLQPKLDAPASVHELEALVQAHQPEGLSTTGRPLHPAQLRARSRVIPLIEYGAAGTYVVLCPRAGELSLVPDSPEWFAWLASLSSFQFVGKLGRFSAHRVFHQGPTRDFQANRSIHQHRYKPYLGGTEHLTIDCLEQVAAPLQSYADSR
jgi:hypothetical protein